MAFLPSKDTNFDGTETLLNLTAEAGGNIDLDAASTVTVPTITVGSSTQKAVNEAALQTYVGAQLSTYATQAALDAAIAGIDFKASVRAVRTTAVNCTARTTTTLTLGVGVYTGEGVTWANGDRVLLIGGTSGSGVGNADNGIYVVSGAGSSIVLTRTSDFDTWSEIPGSMVAVEEGSSNGDKVYLCTADAGGTLGTTAITFTQFGASAASQVAFTPTGNIAATNVQNALAELDTEKLALAGGTMAGAIAMGVNNITGAGSGTAFLLSVTGMTFDSAVAGVALTAAGLYFGPSSGAIDVQVTRTASNEMTVGAGDNLKHDTEVAGTNDTVVATTAFVQRDSRRKNVATVADGSFPYTITVSSNLPSADVVITQQTALSRAVNLPAANALAQGTVIVVKDGSASGARTYPITVNRAGSDTIDGLTSDTIDTTSEARSYMTDGTSKWYRI